jgi:hypothetical protein
LAKANTQSIIKFSSGIKTSSDQAPEYPALLMIRQSGTINIPVVNNTIIQCQMLKLPILNFPLVKKLIAR